MSERIEGLFIPINDHGAGIGGAERSARETGDELGWTGGPAGWQVWTYLIRSYSDKCRGRDGVGHGVFRVSVVGLQFFLSTARLRRWR